MSDSITDAAMSKIAQHKRAIRQQWLAVHLYLGLSLGLLLSVIGITGSLLVFYLELDEVLNPELAIAEPSAPRLPYQTIFNAIRQAEPDRPNGWRLEIPDNPRRVITARYYKPRETEQLGFAPLLLSVHPQTGEVLKQRFWGQFAMTWLYDLHYTLLLAASGKIVMAVVGGCLLVSLLSGLYLWWPSAGKWRSALGIKSKAGKQRLTYDLHKVAGVYGFIAMLALALTGIALEIPDYVNPLIGYFSPLQQQSAAKSQIVEQSAAITLDRAVAIARQRFPQAELAWIETPHGRDGCYRINLYQSGEPSRRFPKTNVWIDQYSGRVIRVNDPFTETAGDTLIHWLHPLHSGEALAMPGRLLVLAAGLSCPLLFVTGVMRWLQKRSGRRRLIEANRAGR
ncbi:PepSY-associated TM helix domain-containing protein [Methylomonas methanica]|nr:PepSY-associated TM helix domain-containing protein [Methylomonas methanica]